MNSNHFWLKSSHSFQELFTTIGTPANHAPGTYLFIQGDTTDYFYYLIEGSVKIVIFWEDGSEKTLINQEGGLLGVISAFNQIPQFTTAIVTKPSTLIKVNSAALINYISNKPDLMLSFFQELGTKVHLLTLQLSTMSFLTVEKRICYTLLMLSQDAGSDTSDGLKISVRMTDQELANLIGTSRVTISKVLSSLKKHNLITKIHNHIYILDKEGLRNFVFSKNGMTWNI
ncbi:Crp/Fnr family transcriptional regulator [Paenibacillus periandrae]|uniref:Crp/Fnr family transcriptional regulator n=1 Tax=Paenibacillus periandrae TaxID=1761741 RepID=UPI001F09ABC0|nr:Crp/Fnr family transcriptional regulator [Paenibacillus periandrae]